MLLIVTPTGGGKPTAPTIGTATAGNGSATVAFTASTYGNFNNVVLKSSGVLNDSILMQNLFFIYWSSVRNRMLCNSQYDVKSARTCSIIWYNKLIFIFVFSQIKNGILTVSMPLLIRLAVRW